MFRELFEIRRTTRKWHLAVLAATCVGIPLIGGYMTGNMAEGKLASLAGLVILYTHPQNIVRQMITLMACSFGLMLAFTLGLVFSFNPWWGALILGVFATATHLSLFYLRMSRPPGNFFFILFASIAVCMPFDLHTLPHRVGLIGIGTMISCILGLVYSLVVFRSESASGDTVTIISNQYVSIIESVTFGVFVAIALLVARVLDLENPYWVPTSCVAVMQGASVRHVWQRSIHRIVGTLIGLLVTWCVLLLQPSLLTICISIIVLQVIVELLVVRNYGIAVIFITVLTIFLAESGNALVHDPNELIITRFMDIVIGSLLGGVGGYVLYNEKVRFVATRQIRKTKIALSRKRDFNRRKGKRLSYE